MAAFFSESILSCGGQVSKILLVNVFGSWDTKLEACKQPPLHRGIGI